MRKTLSLAIILVLVFSLAACGKREYTLPTNNYDNPANTLTASITPAKGWESKQAAYPSYECKKEGVEYAILFLESARNIHQDAEPKEFVESVYKTIKENPIFASVDFGEVNKITVGGLEAYEYSYTLFGQVHRTIYVYKENKCYPIECSYNETDYELTKDDYQKMLDSYKLK